MRLLWVVPRYGADVVGGAETLVRSLATRAVPGDWTSEVASTCAVDHETWANVHPPGTAVENGVPVHRFEVGKRDPARYERLHPRILDGTARYADEIEWLANSVWAPGLDAFLEREGTSYDLIVLAPYLFGTTIWGAFVCPERSALLPCLHDEPYARLETVRRAFTAVRGTIFNTQAEADLAARLYDVRDEAVVGMGFDVPSSPPAADFGRELGPYLLYAGRLEAGKRVDIAVEYAVRYAAERRDAPKLVLAGRGSYRPPQSAEGVVVEAGALGPEESRAAKAGALALVVPSVLESLSIVLLEGWLEGTPALVAAGSEVLRSHVEASGGGIAFETYEDFRDALDQLRSNRGAAQELGAAGREYVADAYGWPAVRARFQSAIERLAA